MNITDSITFLTKRYTEYFDVLLNGIPIR